MPSPGYSHVADAEAVTAFLNRQGEAKPRVTPWGNQFQLSWKVRLFPDFKTSAKTTLACGWSYFQVKARTLDAAVSKALAKEYLESRTLISEDPTPESELDLDV